jgi:hypothetical protein
MGDSVCAPLPPSVSFSVGVTGHRQAHGGYAGAEEAITATLNEIMIAIDDAVSRAKLPFDLVTPACTRLVTLLVDGTDQLAANMAIVRGWTILSPLPFGRTLNLAINALPEDAADARALLAGVAPIDPGTRKRAAAMESIADKAQLFELADQDERIATLYLSMLDAKEEFERAQAFGSESATRAALAGRVLIEQSDLLIAVWDGVSTANLGGAGDTVARALDMAAPVIWINPAAPSEWRVLRAPESLALLDQPIDRAKRSEALEQIVRGSLMPDDIAANPAPKAFLAERWHDTSARLGHAYRRIEALFDGGGRPFRSLVQRYERPDEINTGSGATLLDGIRGMPGADFAFAERVAAIALPHFAWADGISARHSDTYRGGMIANFVMSALAIVGGTLYLPLAGGVLDKWIFALFELLLLLIIIVITTIGQRRHWHMRWFETRRVAEYLRHSPLMLMLGSARPPGLWPQATGSAWPEWYVRHALRDIGLPHIRITPAYLRAALDVLINTHVIPQRDYHFSKAKRLKSVHHNLDRFSEWLFRLAILSVATYLLLKGLTLPGWIDKSILEASSKTFTVLAVLFPTFGAAIAGIRYFGDFDRFSAISEVTAEKLDAIHSRARLLADAPNARLHYGVVNALMHAADDVVVSEIENWQSVFGGKNINVPV